VEVPTIMLPRFLAALFGGFVLLPAHAIEPDKYLPNDTDAVVTINVQQILASPLVKTHYAAALPELFKANDELQKVLKGVGLDPLKDIQQILFANGEGLYRLTKGVEKGKVVYGSTGGFFCLVKGRFDTAKFRAYGDQLSKEKDNILTRTHKVGTAAVYELDLGRPLFVGVLDSTSIAVSSRLEPVIEAMEKATGKRKMALKYKELTPALARIDGKKSVGIAVIASAGFGLDAEVKKVGGKVIETPIKQTISQDGIDAISGSIQVADGITGDVSVTVRGAAVAKDVAKSLQMDLTDGIDLILRALFKYPKLGPISEFIKGININVKDSKTVTIQASVDAKQVADSLK
jgi:hypothetical protein